MQELVTVTITLDTMEKVRRFVAIAGKYPFEMDLRCGRYVVDAKSILGILSLGSRTDIKLDIYGTSPDAFLSAISVFRSEQA